jgi:biopolymer transport protein ExbD
MSQWDVFHSERLEAQRSLTSEAVRQAIDRGDLIEDDLIRPSGETRWTRLGDSPEFGPFPSPARPGEDAPVSAADTFEPPSAGSDEFEVVYDDDDLVRPDPIGLTLPDDQAAGADLPEIDEVADEYPDDDDDDEDIEEFTLSRNSTERVEELDLAAMVDVAFQLVLFFLVTAQVVLFKTLEVPRPNDDKPPEAAAQGRSKSVDELEKDYILVEVDAAGAIKVDRQPVSASRPALMETLRTSRDKTARKAMLLSADFATRHENAVLVFDVANEIDLQIAIAQPPAKK